MASGVRAADTQAVPAVVTCELRTIEAPRAEVNRLLPNSVYVLKPEQLQPLEKLIDQKRARILTQTRTTTTPGQVTQVKAAQEFTYPAALLELLAPKPWTAPIAPSIGGAYKTSELGSIWNVTPTVGADRKTILLVITGESSMPSKARVTRYEGISSAGKMETEQPDLVFSELTTSVVLRSGSTVVAGIFNPADGDTTDAKSDNVVVFLVSAAVTTFAR
jgi:hypothetical protein